MYASEFVSFRIDLKVARFNTIFSLLRIPISLQIQLFDESLSNIYDAFPDKKQEKYLYPPGFILSMNEHFFFA